MDPEKCPMNPVDSEVVVSSRPEPEKISIISDLWLAVSVITFLADVGSDLLVCIHYYNQNSLWYFWVTVGLVVAASLVLQILSTKWFIDDGKKSCQIFILHLLQLGPIARYCSAIRLCWMSRHGHISNAYERFVPKWRDLSMLRLLQAFIQAAPQAVFQLYILCHKGSFVLEHDLIVVLSAVTSIVTVVWSLVCYSKALRDLRENAQDLPWVGFTCQCLWRTCMLTSRVVALVLFASHFQHWTFLAVFGHWLLMAMWLACQRTQFCVDETGREHPWKERVFNSLIAFIYIFSFFNTKEGMTRKRVVLYYSVMLVENSLLISMWYPNRNLNSVMTHAALITVWGGFLLGLIFMIIYYKCYHHSHAFKGLFVRTKTFSLHDRNMYGLYFCCCCRVKKWDVAIYDCRESSAELSVTIRQGGDQDQSISPEVHHPYDALHWDNGDMQIRPLNGVCVRGDECDPENAALVAEDEQVPDIIVTAASPLVLSPQESVSRLTSGDSSTQNQLEHDANNPPQSPGQTSLDRAREILASKLAKDTETQNNDDQLNEEEEEEDIPKINYGSVSFGNRYSLVSSDCISISSESSISSFTNSLNDLLDRMGLAPKKDENGQTDLKITATTDEGIYSDERESPAKSGDPECDPSPPCIDLDSSISPVSPISSNVVNGDSDSLTTPNHTPRKHEPFNVLETIMDAPSSPFFTAKRKRKLHDKDEGSESESTDASSDDRERRHSCEEFFTDFSLAHSTPNEDKTKRHSFDIAELSSNYNKAKKKNKNKRRFNKMIIFDNFVSSPLKPGRFGSLRKSFERLSKIQEDTEELGLLSNESLKEKRQPQVTWSPSLDNETTEETGEPRTLAAQEGDVVTNHNDVPFKEPDPLVVQQPIETVHSPEENKPANPKIHENDEKPALANGQLGDVSSSSEVSEDEEFLIEDLKPSRFSTVRRSRDNVPLACCEDFDDDLGSSSGDDINNVSDGDDIKLNINAVDDSNNASDGDVAKIDNSKDINKIDHCIDINKIDDGDDINSVDDGDTAPLTITPTLQKKTRKLHWSTDSIAGSESSRGSLPNDTTNRSMASSGSSIFENFLFQENDQNSPQAQPNKRHTFDFGSHRKNNVRNEKIKRLGTSSSHYSLPRNPGSPVWVHKAIYTHRRRKPKPNSQQQNNDNPVGLLIQEVRV